MELTGYNDVDSVSRLKDPKELQAMFDFAADLFDGVDNKEEVYGHFSKNPKCLRILPGIADAFKTFLEEVNKMKPTDQSLVNPSKRKRKVENHGLSLKVKFRIFIKNLLLKNRFESC